jgi:hypothetical protein
MTVAIDSWRRTTITFEYSRDPVVHSVIPLSSIASGGTTYVIRGRDLNRPQIRHLVFYSVPNSLGMDPPSSGGEGDHSKGSNFQAPVPSLGPGPVTECLRTWNFTSEPCSGKLREIMECTAPELSPGLYAIGVLMDAACRLLDLQTTVTVHDDPIFSKFNDALVFSETEFLREDIVISVTGERFYFAQCDVTFNLTPCTSRVPCLCEALPWNQSSSGSVTEVQCVLAAANLQDLPRDEPIIMIATVGNVQAEVGAIVIQSSHIGEIRDNTNYVIAGIVVFIFLLLIAIAVVTVIIVYRIRAKQRAKQRKNSNFRITVWSRS